MKVQYLSLRFFQCFFQFQTYDDYLHLGNFDGLSCPTPVEEIDTFEKNNSKWAINIIAMKADKVDKEKLENWRKKKKKNRFLKGYLRQEETQEKNIGTERNNEKKKDNIQIFPYRYKYIYIYIYIY